MGSATILNKLLTMPEFEIAGIVKSQTLGFTPEGAMKMRRHLKQVGWRFGWHLFLQQAILMFGYLLNIYFNFNEKGLLPAWMLAKRHRIPVIDCLDVNDPKTVAFIEKIKPDLIVSAYFNLILKPPIIAIPKHGILNIHPGWLPLYRGVMTYFWVLKNSNEKAGVSVHWIDEGVDTGALVARRSFNIEPGMTQQRVLTITAIIGARLLKRIATKLLSGETPETIDVNIKEASYYPMPDSNDFDEYAKKRPFFKIIDLLRYVIRI